MSILPLGAPVLGTAFHKFLFKCSEKTVSAVAVSGQLNEKTKRRAGMDEVLSLLVRPLLVTRFMSLAES